MRTLTLVRHSNAEDYSDLFSDFERSLTAKGKRIAHEMASSFKESNDLPGVIITSPAFRALETAIIFATEWKCSYDIINTNIGLYNSYTLMYIQKLLSEIVPDIDNVMIIGHNPTISDIAFEFTKTYDESMAKCEIVSMAFGCNNWKDVKVEVGKIVFNSSPKKNLSLK
jgi:phosphohistidine phosphatase